MTATAEDWVRRIEEVLDKFNLSKEEYWKDPDKFYENIKDEEINRNVNIIRSTFASYIELDSGYYTTNFNTTASICAAIPLAALRTTPKNIFINILRP